MQQKLNSSELDALLVERPLDLFYLTGLKLSTGKLLISAKECTLLVDGRYLQIAQEKSPCPSMLDTPGQLLKLCQAQGIKRLGFDGQHTSYDHFVRLGKGLTLVPASACYKNMRAIKDEAEILKMKKSAALLWEGFEFIRAQLKEGITERAVAKAFEIFCLQKGADGLSFEPIIAFGANGAMPHYRSQDVALKIGDAVLIDIGVVVDSYHSDMTRVVFFKQEDAYVKQLYSIAHKAQRAALAGSAAQVQLLGSLTKLLAK